MNIVFVGAGNLATNLAIALKEASHNIMQIYSRTTESAKDLAEKVEALYTNKISEMVPGADVYIFSVKDSAIENILTQISPNNGLWVHTAGSLSMDILEKHNERIGVFYPFQTFSKNRQVSFSNIPIFIEAKSEDDINILNILAKSVSNKIYKLSSEKRKYIHLTGIFGCNFVNCMYTISQQILEKENIPFDVLLPLIDETAKKVHDMLPEKAQTGPAIRFDTNIINKHLALIEDKDQREIYNLVSEYIHKNNKQ